MRSLPELTLACIDTANHALALRALALSMRDLAFGQTLFLTDRIPLGVAVPGGVEVRKIAPLASRDDYSRFVLKSLVDYVGTAHVLVIQWDGYVVNAQAWDDTFLGVDYLGAKWYWHDDAMRVGNGGFSLRSKKLLDALQDSRIDLAGPGDAEDVAICRTNRPLLERDYGIRFGSEALADRFAFEAAYPIGMPFGFHGLYNFCRVVPADDLAALAPRFSDAIAASPQLGQLVRNCVALGQWAPAAALAKRRLAAIPADGEARALLERAEGGLAKGPVVGRNEPCPCGSGKRYKECHGAIDGAGTQSLNPAVASPAGTSSPIDGHETAGTLAQRGLDAHKRGDVDAAEHAYREALERDPGHPLALHFLGVVRYQQGRAAEALPLLESAAARVPQEAEFHNNLGLALSALDRDEDAVAAHRAAIALRSGHATAWNNLGLALTAMNRVSEAIDAYRHALAAQADFAHAHWNLALALLAQGEYEEGWREYEWRLRLPELGANAPAPPAPRWAGEDLDGRNLLVTTEQGLGDAIQFVRFARMLAARGARVTVETLPALARLLATAPGVTSTSLDGKDTPDYSIPLLSIPGALGIRAGELACAVPYLHAVPETRARAARVIAAGSAGRKRRVGLAWAGSPAHANDRRRSVALAKLTPLFASPDIAWFSLQKGASEKQIAELPEGARPIGLDLDGDLADTAAFIDAFDAVVSVDTSIAHLAGALGKPVFILLPYAADWRWGVTGERTPWYPTARLLRQPASGDWESVVVRLGELLAASA